MLGKMSSLTEIVELLKVNKVRIPSIASGGFLLKDQRLGITASLNSCKVALDAGPLPGHLAARIYQMSVSVPLIGAF